MAGGYVTPDGDIVDQLVEQLRGLQSRVRELEKPTGTQTAGTVAYLKSLVTVGEGRPTLNTGDVAGDQTRHWFDTSPPAAVTVNAPTGRVLITVACGEASLEPGDSSAVAYASFEISTEASGAWWPAGTSTARLFLTNSNGRLGVPLMLSLPVSVQKTVPVTITAKFAVWSSSTTDLAECSFANPYINVQVIDEV